LHKLLEGRRRFTHTTPPDNEPKTKQKQKQDKTKTKRLLKYED
jgi:hypothetical protein